MPTEPQQAVDQNQRLQNLSGHLPEDVVGFHCPHFVLELVHRVFYLLRLDLHSVAREGLLDELQIIVSAGSLNALLPVDPVAHAQTF